MGTFLFNQKFGYKIVYLCLTYLTLHNRSKTCHLEAIDYFRPSFLNFSTNSSQWGDFINTAEEPGIYPKLLNLNTYSRSKLDSIEAFRLYCRSSQKQK